MCERVEDVAESVRIDALCSRCGHPRQYHKDNGGECWGGGRYEDYLCDCPNFTLTEKWRTREGFWP